MHVSSTKDCYCHTCKKDFHYLGITRHRAAHRDRQEDCEITFTHGDRHRYLYSQNREGITKVAKVTKDFMEKRLFDEAVATLEKNKLPRHGEVLVATQFGFKSLPPDSPLIIKAASV